MNHELSEQFYRIQAIDRALRIPSVNCLWGKSTQVYGKVKSVNIFTNWAFETVETIINRVSLSVSRFMEIIKEEPKEILDRTKSLVVDRLSPAVKIFVDLKQETKQRVRIITLHTYYKVHHFRVYSWQQADKVMSTETGINILKTVDNTVFNTELMLDKYLPALENENYSDFEDECSEHVKLHHTIVRLSEFSSKASRRIYYTLVERLQHMYKIEILILILHAIIVIQAIKLTETMMSSVLKIINDRFISH